MPRSRTTYRLPVHPDDDRTLYVLFTITPPNGDGWNEPRDEGGPEFQGVTDADGNPVSAEDWEWAEARFADERAEACAIAADAEDYAREQAADWRRDARMMGDQ